LLIRHRNYHSSIKTVLAAELQLLIII